LDKESINKSFVRKIIDSSNIEIEKIIRMRMKNLGINQKYGIIFYNEIFFILFDLKINYYFYSLKISAMKRMNFLM
jgi:hypothetical protein